jgi:ABC-2 type transport system ATP-binding protein
MEAILEVDKLSRRLGAFALEDVSFSLPRGTIMGFIGPNGAGKTTTLKIILGLVRKDSGTVRIFGLDHVQDGPRVRQKVGFVFDENVYYEDFTPREIGWLMARFYEAWDEPRFRGYLQEFSLPPAGKIRELSRGMKAKLALAVALSHDAELIVMDEPTSGLDPVFRVEMLEILRGVIADENRSVLFSTHVTSDLEKVADYVTFIHQGRIVFSRMKDDLLASYAMVKGTAETLEKARPHLVGVRQHAFGFEALCADRDSLRGLPGPGLLVERASIDDIMVYSTKYAETR